MSIFDDIAQMHADCDAAFAHEATFAPQKGAPVSCSVERFRPEPELGLNDARTPIPDELLRVLKASLPQRPARGDIFIIGSETRRVIAAPIVEDDDGLRWTVRVEKV